MNGKELQPVQQIWLTAHCWFWHPASSLHWVCWSTFASLCLGAVPDPLNDILEARDLPGCLWRALLANPQGCQSGLCSWGVPFSRTSSDFGLAHREWQHIRWSKPGFLRPVFAAMTPGCSPSLLTKQPGLFWYGSVGSLLPFPSNASHLRYKGKPEPLLGTTVLRALWCN